MQPDPSQGQKPFHNLQIDIGVQRLCFPIFHPNFYEVFTLSKGEDLSPLVLVSLINAPSEEIVRERMDVGLKNLGSKYAPLSGPGDAVTRDNYTVSLLDPRRSPDRIINEQYDLVEFLDPLKDGHYAGCTNFVKFFIEKLGCYGTTRNLPNMPEEFKTYLLGKWRPVIKPQLRLVVPEVA